MNGKDWQHEVAKLTAKIETLDGEAHAIETERQGLLLRVLDHEEARAQVSALAQAIAEKRAEIALQREILPLAQRQLREQQQAARLKMIEEMKGKLRQHELELDALQAEAHQTHNPTDVEKMLFKHRQCYALSCDLAEATGDARLRRNWDPSGLAGDSKSLENLIEAIRQQRPKPVIADSDWNTVKPATT